jgi:hypothetical protein
MPPVPADPSLTTVVLTVFGLPNAWSQQQPAAVIAGLRADLATAAAASESRFTVLSFTPARVDGDVPAAVLQIAGPLSAPFAPSADRSTAAVVSALYEQLQAPLSLLRVASFSRGLDPKAKWTALWSGAPQAAFAPADKIAFAVPFVSSSGGAGAPVRKPVVISNNGATPLFLTAAALSVVDPGPYTPAVTQQLLALEAPAGGKLPSTQSGPVVVNAGGSVTLNVVFYPAHLPAQATAPLFAILSVGHNALGGQSSLPISMDITSIPANVPGSTTGTDGSILGILQSTEFRAGALTTLAAFVVAAIIALVVWCKKRKQGPKYGRIGSDGISSAPTASGGSGGPPRTSFWQTLKFVLTAKRPVRPPSGASSAGASSFAASARGPASPPGSTVPIPEPSDDSDAEESDSARLSTHKGASASVIVSGGGGNSGTGIEMSTIKSAMTFASPASASSSSATSAITSTISAGTPVHGMSGNNSSSTISSGGSGGGLFSSLTVSGAPSTPLPGSASAVAATPRRRLVLKAKPHLKASEFESKWASLSTVDMWGATLRAQPAQGELEKALSAQGIVCMASGTVGGVSKYYFFAQEDATAQLFMAEVSVNIATLRLSAVLKAGDASLGEAFVAKIKEGLADKIAG